MNLLVHEVAFHLGGSLLAAYFSWIIFAKPKNKFLLFFFAALLGGFFIDIDHLFDYFLAFGPHFNLTYFFKGYQFLKSNKIYIPFHSAELAIILIITPLLIKKYRPQLLYYSITLLLFFSFGLSLLFHLSADVMINELPVRSYFLTYRIIYNFELKELVYPQHYQRHLKERKLIKLIY
jgi:hypothetical protein